ncbi:MAG: FliG C-terminal domain-containing protein [Pirellulales bacterium]
MQKERLRKAAVLVAALDRPAADALLAQMSEAEAARVRRAVVEWGPFEPEEQESVLAEFAAAAPPPRNDGVEWAPSAEAASAAPQPASPPALQPFRLLAEAAVDTLVPLLESERPQTVALVLAHLPPDKAAPVLTALSDSLQTAVVRRLAALDDAHPEMLREVERSLSARCLELERRRKRRESSQQALVEILAAAKQLTGHAEPLDDESPAPLPLPAAAARSRWQMLELLLLDNRSLGEVLGACDEDVLLLALAGADPATYARLAQALSAHELRWVEGRLARLGPTRLADLERAAEQLLSIAARLEQRGALHRPNPRPALAA